MDKLVDSYLRLAEEQNEEDFWAFEEVDTLVREKPLEAQEVILKLIDKAPDDKTLAYVAAGPLEDLLARHGEKVIDWVEDNARKNSKFAIALACVWRNSIKEEIWQRVIRFRKAV
ncbi:MAG TPA: hypothetical protein VLG67_03340 [Candidatus Saccharimonadales bacterium]|nr:hypothetical protein [Candidatus Saccharimonadales bacterium]